MVQLGFHGKVVINKHTKIVSFVGKGNGTVANDNVVYINSIYLCG